MFQLFLYLSHRFGYRWPRNGVVDIALAIALVIYVDLYGPITGSTEVADENTLAWTDELEDLN